MKKVVIMSAFIVLFSTLFPTQAKGKREVKDLGNFKLHVYTADAPMPDLSFIIEGEKEMVILEPPAFKESIKDFQNYAKELGKPIAKIIIDYHTGGINEWDKSKVVMVEGMPEFSRGEAYEGLLAYFRQTFGDAIDLRDVGNPAVISRTAKENWADVTFNFMEGVTSDFPASSIVIGNEVYYMHFSPTKAHFSNLQITSRDAIDATLAELNRAKKSGCRYFIGGHGALAEISDVDFQISYLNTMKQTLKTASTKADFISQMKKAYPNTAEEDNLAGLADVLFS